MTFQYLDIAFDTKPNKPSTGGASGGEGMAQGVKSLLCKHEGLSSNFQHPCKSQMQLRIQSQYLCGEVCER